ncbi:MAG: hypothetical protein ACMUIP_03880 [bacterium]
MVIVVLAILAATAVPKYFSLKTEAQEAVADGITASLRGSVTILYAKNLVTTTNNTGEAYTLTDVVLNSNIDGVDDQTYDGTNYTATIGGTTYTWEWDPTADLPNTPGTITAL